MISRFNNRPIGESLKARRVDLGLSRGEVVAALGVDPGAVRKLEESKKREMPPDRLPAILENFYKRKERQNEKRLHFEYLRDYGRD